MKHGKDEYAADDFQICSHTKGFIFSLQAQKNPTQADPDPTALRHSKVVDLTPILYNDEPYRDGGG